MEKLNPGAIEALPVADWDIELQQVIDDMGGRPLNVHALLANHPPLLKAWWEFRNYVVGGGALGQRHAELVILRTAWHARSWYEWASHVVRGMAAGLSADEIDRVSEGPAHRDWSDTDALVLRATDNLHDLGAIQPRTLEPLENAVGSNAVLDLVAIRGTYVMLGNFLATWNVQLDEQVEAALPARCENPFD